MRGEKAKPGNGLRRKARRCPYPRAQCRRHGGGWCVHEGDHREKPERRLPGGEGGKEGAACFCTEIASCSTSQRIKYIAEECERALLSLYFRNRHRKLTMRAWTEPGNLWLRVGPGLHLEWPLLFSSFRKNSSLSTSLAIQLKPFRF